ncbi:MAG: galactokinase [Desulfobulbaceae bacterium]|nr:MAG: galactokinase [Desulfobulbaceae bacterium]
MIAPRQAYLHYVDGDSWAAPIRRLYGAVDEEWQRERMTSLLHRHYRRFGAERLLLVSAPGRTELGGNHTDHQHGRVLAAAVHLDCLAAATPNGTDRIRLSGEGVDAEIDIDCTQTRPRPEEEGTPQALVRGVIAGFRERGLATGGFDTSLHATVRPGTGLSSSAAFSVLIGEICNLLFNGNRLGPLDLALIAQSAENGFFGKPCGLMDQLACAAGRILHIDFNDPVQPVMEVVDSCPFTSRYCLAVVDTGGSHSGLTDEYAAIPGEMSKAATVLGQPFARGLAIDQVRAGLPQLRRQAGDRAILRLFHFIRENDRVMEMVEALRAGDTGTYLQLVRASGDSSWRLLQNCTSRTSSEEQGVPLALALTEMFLADGAWRVHGGGFAGTIQVYVPQELFEAYRQHMEGVFGSGCVIELQVGRPGVCAILPDGRLLPAGQEG